MTTSFADHGGYQEGILYKALVTLFSNSACKIIIIIGFIANTHSYMLLMATSKLCWRPEIIILVIIAT